MGLFTRKQDDWTDPATVAPEDAIRSAREALGRTHTCWNGSGQRRRMSAEQHAHIDAVLDRMEAAQARQG